MGGDDYVTKPFSPRELLARIKAVLRRSTKSTIAKKVDKGLLVEEEKLIASFNGKTLDLTKNEFLLLAHLNRFPTQVFSRYQLMEAVWEEPESAGERTVDAHIKTLRKKLKAMAPEIDFIQTHRGFGYSFREDFS